MSDKKRIEELETKLASAEAELKRLQPEEKLYVLPESLRQAIVDYMGNAPSGSVPGRVPMQLVGALQGLKPIESEHPLVESAGEEGKRTTPRKRKLNGAEDTTRASLRAARERA